jgi:hypothetical protein
LGVSGPQTSVHWVDWAASKLVQVAGGPMVRVMTVEGSYAQAEPCGG